MAASGIRTKNDTILSEREYRFYKSQISQDPIEGINKYNGDIKVINTGDGYSNFYKEFLSDKYLNDLSDNYFKEIGITKESVKAEMRKLREAIEQTKKAAGEKGVFNRYGNLSFEEMYDVENCAELWSVRQAIMEGAKFDEIEYKCVSRKSGVSVPPCENCSHTFSTLKNSGKEDEWYVE